MQRTRHGGVSHGTHKDRHILSQAAKRQTQRSICHPPPGHEQMKSRIRRLLTLKALWFLLDEF